MSFYKFINHSVYKYGWSARRGQDHDDGEVSLKVDDDTTATTGEIYDYSSTGLSFKSRHQELIC